MLGVMGNQLKRKNQKNLKRNEKEKEWFGMEVYQKAKC